MEKQHQGNDKIIKIYPIKVLVIVQSMNCGGLESRLMDIIRTIDYNKVCIDVYTYSYNKGIFDDEIKSLGGIIYYNKPLTIGNMLNYPTYFATFIKEHPEYKIIHAHQDAWCTVFCKGAKMADVPVRIAHSRTAATNTSLKNIVRNIIKLPVKKYATHFFAVSDVAGEWLFGKKAYRDGNVSVWPNAIDCKKFIFDYETRNKVRTNLNLEGQYVIMHVGNFVPAKNHKFLIEIFSKVLKKRKNSKLILVGKGDISQFRDMANRLKISEKIEFLGVRLDINELLQAADVFLFPSLFEGLPGAVLEAQAAGLACIISDVITDNVCIVKELVRKIYLSESPDLWCQAILDVKDIQRQNTYDNFVKKGFDIHSLVETLTNFYINAGDDELK